MTGSVITRHILTENLKGYKKSKFGTLHDKLESGFIFYLFNHGFSDIQQIKIRAITNF